ncbi:MAG: hypothetical protein LBQ89_02185 [Treponema sp.]|jgi:hypothetical protein|nr:hypothetical protein [Treponema sp.]
MAKINQTNIFSKAKSDEKDNSESAPDLKKQYEAAAKKKIEKIREELEKRYASMQEQLENEIEEKKNALSQREAKVREAEIVMKNGFNDEKDKINKEISDLRIQRNVEMEKLIDAEQSARLMALENDLKAKRAKFEEEKKAEEQELENRKNELKQQYANFGKEKDDVDFQKRSFDRKLEGLRLREPELEKEACRKAEAIVLGLERKNKDLSEKLRSEQEQDALIDKLKNKYGDKNLQEIENNMKLWEEKIKSDKNENEKWLEAKRAEIREEFIGKNKELEELLEENKQLKGQVQNLIEQKRETEPLVVVIDKKDRQILALNDEKTVIERERNLFETRLGNLDKELQEYRNYFKDAEGVEKRKVTIETPPPGFDVPRERRNGEEEISEMKWLSKIHDSCKEHGYIFPSRLLYAFHTALKTADWSCITVLAGVSGTGKSKLPELYSHFGGINFFNLPVQPNWDSKESMLGFFNSIERKFDAQPVLQFLAQTQKDKADDYPGLKDTLSIILLDEMNLANVELYFAEFLSKLEERSGKSPGEEPAIDVKLGSGDSDYYPLKLGRNVLWVGTMNQDETTKSLSDKVLDRGIVISFPRPASLKHEKKKFLPDRTPLLPVMLWDKWKQNDTAFVSDWVGECRVFVERINECMGRVNLAIGYRVWQSIEQYMINHPLVLSAKVEIEKAQQNQEKETAVKKQNSALKDAFEDQLAQKVMPKLRGIETSGTQDRECLKPIRELLEEKGYEELVKDFKNADLGGQFVWNSSNYLNKY